MSPGPRFDVSWPSASAGLLTRRRAWLAGAALALGFALCFALPSAPVDANTPTRFSRAAIAMCQSGCDAVRDDHLRATCKLKCFEDPNTASPLPSTAPSTTPAAQPAVQPAVQPGGSRADTGPAAVPPAKPRVQTQTHGGAQPADVGSCTRACDANLSLSDTDRATCKLTCEREGPTVTTWSVSGSPAQVRCAKRCHCESSCADDSRRCQRSCDAMPGESRANAASCKLQCESQVGACQRSCTDSTPNPNCSCD